MLWEIISSLSCSRISGLRRDLQRPSISLEQFSACLVTVTRLCPRTTVGAQPHCDSGAPPHSPGLQSIPELLLEGAPGNFVYPRSVAEAGTEPGLWLHPLGSPHPRTPQFLPEREAPAATSSGSRSIGCVVCSGQFPPICVCYPVLSQLCEGRCPHLTGLDTCG